MGGEEQILALSRLWLLGLFFSCGDAEVAAFDFHDKAALGEIVELAILEFLSLAVVPVLHWAIVAGDAAVDFGLVAADRAGELLAGDVAVVFADGIGWRQGVVRQLVVLGDLAHEIGGCFPVRQFFAEEGVENGAGGVKCLQFVLDIEGREDVFGVADRQVRAVGVVWGVPFLRCGDDVRIAFAVMLGEAIGGGFCWGGFEVVEIAVFFLIIRETVAHVVEHFLGEFLGLGVGEIGAQPVGVEANFVHADEADGGEMVVKAAEVALGVWIEASVEQIGDDGALGLQGTRSDVHEMVEACVEICFVLGEICDAWQVDGDNADGACAFPAAEEAAALFAQLAQIETETAAHAAHIAWLHVAVDVVGEIWRAVFGGHFKEQAVVFRIGPVKFLGDGIGWDRILEAAALGVAFDHDFDEGFVDHVHFTLAVAVGEIHFLAADDGWQILEIVWHGPVEGDVGEWRLGAPAAWRVDTINEAFDAFLGLVVGQVVGLDEWRQVSIKGRERLRAGPFVLHDAEEVDHLVAEGGEMLRWRRGDLARNAAKPFLDQLLQAPAGAVAGEHGKIVEMDVAISVSVGHFLVIDLAEPVIGGDGAGVG